MIRKVVISCNQNGMDLVIAIGCAAVRVDVCQHEDFSRGHAPSQIVVRRSAGVLKTEICATGGRI